MLERRRFAAHATAALCALALVLACAGPAGALGNSSPPPIGSTEDPNSAAKPPGLRDVGYDQKIGARLPLDTELRDEQGRPVRMGDFFGHGRPVILAMVYYECPMLCTMVLNGVVSGLKPLALTAGKDFDVVAVSFNPRETAALAKAKKLNYLDRYGRAGTEDGWHFLTAEPAAIERIASAVGFRYVWDATAKQYAHPSGIVLLTPDGEISRYLFGVDYEPKDLKLGLVESSQGRLGTFTDQVLLYCFHYDPATGRYSTAVINLVRAGGVVTLVLLGLFFAAARRRDAAQARRGAEGAL